METLLLHEDLINGPFFEDVCNMLKREGVSIVSGPTLNQRLTFGPPPAKDLRTEYSDLKCAVEIVKGTKEAINHIHTFGSGHTDVIVTENGEWRGRGNRTWAGLSEEEASSHPRGPRC